MINKLSKYILYYPSVFVETDGFFNFYDDFNKSQYYQYEKIMADNLSGLLHIISFAKKRVPAYKKLYAGIELKNIQNLEEISKLPFVTKTMLKNCENDFISDEKNYFLTPKTTGGSTGQPITIYKTRYSLGRELAATWRGYHWAGVNIGDKQARFWGVPFDKAAKIKALLTDFICHRKRLSAFAFDECCLDGYLVALIRFKPNYFYGYASMLNDFADYLLTTKQVSPFSLKSIISTAEVLSDVVREKLEEVFRTKVFNEYGCGEVGTIAHECPEGRLHISAENMLVEIVDDRGQTCEPGTLGEIVVTELNNTAMPLIRYRLGDLGKLSTDQCKCGRQLPVLEEVRGRAYDTVRLQNGKMFHGEFFMYIFEGVKRRGFGLSQFQVVQSERNHFQINIARQKLEGRQELEEYISGYLHAGMGDDVAIDFNYVNVIPRAKSGKMQLIIALQN